MRAVHVSTWVVLLVALARSDAKKGVAIRITGPVRVVVGCPQEHEVPTAEQCSGEDGFCVETGDRCNGTFKILRNSCTDHCGCCVPKKEECPEAEGFFKLPGSSQCLKVLGDSGNWTQADAWCREAGLELAKPVDPAALQTYLSDDHSSDFYWVGARGSTTDPITYKMTWQRDGDILAYDSPLWAPGYPYIPQGQEYCLTLNSGYYSMRDSPGRPYNSQECAYPHQLPVCERIME